jgi:ferric-dicitrate binding protein FerR (iron transport regulator)
MLKFAARWSRRRLVFAGAAALVGLVVIATSWLIHLHELRTPQSLRLADGTEAFFLPDTKVVPAPGYPRNREIRVDGDAFIRVTQADEPLIVRSRLLVLTVRGAAALRVTAYSQQTGEQAEVLQGHVQANKAYPSPYTDPDLLDAGDMTMVNQTIDLLEKERCDLAELRKWSETLVAGARTAE